MVIAYDGTPNSRRAVRYAGTFLTPIGPSFSRCGRRCAPVRIRCRSTSTGHPIPRDPQMRDSDIAFTDAQRTNLEGTELALAAGLAAEPLCIAVVGTVWRTIIDTADNLDADLIVTGTRGTTGLRSLMQSSVADRVLRHGRRPVLIVPPGPA